MTEQAATLAPKPAHVPSNLVFDFDFFAPPGGDEDVQLAWARLHEVAPDIFWTPRNGGHWVATRADDILAIQMDHERFSHRVFIIPADPEEHHTPLPLGVDPPAHGPYRRILTPAFLPKVINAIEDSVRVFAAELIEELAPQGECEFIEAFARKLPIAVFLKMVDLPFEHREFLLPWAEVVVRSSDQAARREAQMNMMHYLAQYVEERRGAPGEDLISTVVHAKVGDRPIEPQEVFNILSLVLFGGLDTVASLLGFIARFLALHPEHRKELITHPERLKNAIEELIRRHGVTNTGRYITHDFTYNGVQLRQGDLIQAPNVLFGLDERMNPDPLKVDFNRESPRLAAFGNGPHTCPGAVLARREIAVFLEEWLKRIPEFSIKPGTKPEMACGYVNGVTRLELVWPTAKRAAP